MIYLLTFSVSCFLFLTSESRRVKKHSLLKWFIIILAIVIPSLLAGFRNPSIGTDIKVYGDFWFIYAGKMSFFEYMKFANKCSVGVVYALLNWIVFQTTGNRIVFYFSPSFIETLCVYLSLNIIKNSGNYILCKPLKSYTKNIDLKNNNKFSIAFSMFCYYTIFYNNSLNLLRQFLAIAVVCLAYAFLIKQNYLVSFFIIVIAVLCHNSAVFAVLLIPLYWATNKINSKQKIYLFNIVLFIAITIIMVLYKPFLLFTISHGILSSRFMTYLEATVVGGRIIRIGFWGILMILACLAFSKMINYYKDNKFILSCITISTAFSFVLFMGNVYAIRMAYYFDFSALVFIPMIPKIYKADFGGKKSRMLVYVLLIIILVGRWYLEYVRANNGQTYPYKFIQL